VEGDVDKVCKHADHVVRSLGKELWKRSTPPQAYVHEQGKCDPPGVWKKNLGWIFRSMINNFYPQTLGGKLWITRLSKARPRAAPG
jgi:hypothetical protein